MMRQLSSTMIPVPTYCLDAPKKELAIMMQERHKMTATVSLQVRGMIAIPIA